MILATNANKMKSGNFKGLGMMDERDLMLIACSKEVM